MSEERIDFNSWKFIYFHFFGERWWDQPGLFAVYTFTVNLTYLFAFGILKNTPFLTQ